MVAAPPNNEPNEAEQSRNDKRRTPAPAVINWQNDKRRDGAANGRATVEKSGGKSTFPLGKPFGDGFRSAGPVGGFTQTKQKTKTGETAEARGERRGDGNERVKKDGDAETSASADAIDGPPAGRLPQSVGNTEADQQIGIIGIGPVVVPNKIWGEVGQRLAIDVVDDCGSEEQAANPPAKIADVWRRDGSPCTHHVAKTTRFLDAQAA